MCVSLSMVSWSAFPGVCFSVLSDVLKYSGAENHHTIGQIAWPSNWLLLVISIAQMGLRWDHLELLHIENSLLCVSHHPWPPPLCNHLWYWCKNYCILQIVRGGKVLRLQDSTVIHWKTFAVVPHLWLQLIIKRKLFHWKSFVVTN